MFSPTKVSLHTVTSYVVSVCICDPVTGEANFVMPTTRLTIGGFNQPAIARGLIELPRNAEKGLSQRFLWLFPKPVCTTMKELEPINQEFYDTLGKTLRIHLVAKTYKQNILHITTGV